MGLASTNPMVCETSFIYRISTLDLRVLIVKMITMISERQAHILELALHAYLQENEPITSQRLFEEGGFGLSPAALRYELARLDEMGYLYQPHVSGGRFPTDLALEWFVNEFVVEGINPDRFVFTLKQTFSTTSPDQRLFYHFANFAADTCDAFCNVYVDDVSYQAGLDDLFARLDSFSPRVVREIVEDVEMLDERLREFSRRVKDVGVSRVFIGKESPVTKSEDLAVMVSSLHGSGFEGVAVLMGSKRMPYKRNLSFLEASRNFFNSL